MRKIAGCACTGMPGTFSPTPASKETASQLSRHASRHVRHARVVMHVGIAIPWLWVKRSRHSRRMRNSQFYVSGPLRWHHMTHQIIGNTIVCSTAYNHSYTLLVVCEGTHLTKGQWWGNSFHIVTSSHMIITIVIPMAFICPNSRINTSKQLHLPSTL